MFPLTQSLTIERNAALDAWGESVFEIGVSHPCRVVERNQLIRGMNGEEIVIKGFALLKGFVKVDYDDRLTWAAEDGETRTEKPLNISYRRDLSGNILFTKVAF